MIEQIFTQQNFDTTRLVVNPVCVCGALALMCVCCSIYNTKKLVILNKYVQICEHSIWTRLLLWDNTADETPIAAQSAHTLKIWVETPTCLKFIIPDLVWFISKKQKHLIPPSKIPLLQTC